ncbi:MAG: glycosyltransferase family 4 protein [Acidimicrobiales bacterium]
MAERRIAFVAPRYGPDVVGGAEAVMREAARAFADRGWQVDVLTTCARDHYTWANHHPAGTTDDAGVTVHRFAVRHDTDRVARDTVEINIQLGVPVSLDEQRLWLTGTLRVPDLFHHLVKHGDEYRAVVFAPYLFWTTAVGSIVAPERTIVMPCLHDEAYAYLEVFRPLLEDSAQIWFLSEPEHQLAHRLADLPSHHLTGAGINIPDHHDAARFRDARSIQRRFVLFAGRREAGKGWNTLLNAFARAVEDHDVDLDLVTFGVGPVDPPASVSDRVIDLGFLDEADLPHAFAAADAYIQPSGNESFSRTIMEAWAAGTPVLGSARSAVVAWHVERSEAGLLFDGEDELVQCLVAVDQNQAAFEALAAGGRQYVLDNYTWDRVGAAMEKAVEELL